MLLTSISGCTEDRALVGRYTNDLGQYVELKKSGKADLYLNFMLIPTDYELRDRQVVFTSPGGTLAAQITDSGCLDFAILGTVCKAGAGAVDSVRARP